MDGLVEEFYVSGAYKRVLFLTNEQAELVKEEPMAIARLLKELRAPPLRAAFVEGTNRPTELPLLCPLLSCHPSHPCREPPPSTPSW